MVRMGAFANEMNVKKVHPLELQEEALEGV